MTKHRYHQCYMAGEDLYADTIYIVRATIHAVQKTNTDDSRTMAHIIRIAYFDWTGMSWCSMHSYHGQTIHINCNTLRVRYYYTVPATTRTPSTSRHAHVKYISWTLFRSMNCRTLCCRTKQDFEEIVLYRGTL